MPTKPAGTVEIWASNLNHLFGDYPGDPTKVSPGAGVVAAGLIPGDPAPPTAEETNHEFNRWTLFLEWLAGGSAAAGINTHVVETNSFGDINVRRGTFTTDGAFLPAVSGTASGGGAGVYGESTQHGVRGKSVFGGSGYGGYFEAESNSGGVRGIGSGSGYGGFFTGGTTGWGILANGGSNGVGGEFNGFNGNEDIRLTPALNYGIDIQCAASALGGIRILCNGQAGLAITQDDPDFPCAIMYGDSAATLGQQALEVRAFGGGTAARLFASSGTGYPLVLTPKSGAPARGALQMGGQTARPTVIDGGQFSYNSSEDQILVSAFSDFGEPGPGVGWRGLWTTTGGFALAYKTKTNYTGIGGAQELVLTIVASAGNAPKLAGRSVVMRLMMSPSVNPSGTECTMNFKVRDATAATDKFTRSGVGNGAGAGVYLEALPSVGWRTSHAVTFDITIPAAGSRTWEVYAWVTGAVFLNLRDISLEFIGTV